MSAKGFGTKRLQRQIRKIKRLEKNLGDVESLRQKGIHFGNVISSAWITQAQKIREETEQVCGHSLVVARLLMVTALADLQSFRVDIPGKTNEKLSEILRLIAIFWQGQFCTEQMILEGQYIKASAVIKQEIEIITRIAEIKQGVAKDGKTPNVKYAPPMLKLHYGDMNDIAHISKPTMLDTLTSIDKGTFRGVSIQPIFHEGISKNLYEIHLSIFYNIILEAIELFQQLYPEDMELVLPAYKLLTIVEGILTESGLTSNSSSSKQTD
jgi:hypothetical protein